jgi:hypothetical protein
MKTLWTRAYQLKLQRSADNLRKPKATVSFIGLLGSLILPFKWSLVLS